jgi:anti-sigma B factor antagonist
MTIEERTAGPVTVLKLRGKITLGDGDTALREKITALLQEEKTKILLNFADVPYIDSAGLGEVVRTYTTLNRQGGQLRLASVTKRISDLLKMARLSTVLETHDEEADALKSFN